MFPTSILFRILKIYILLPFLSEFSAVKVDVLYSSSTVVLFNLYVYCLEWQNVCEEMATFTICKDIKGRRQWKCKYL